MGGIIAQTAAMRIIACAGDRVDGRETDGLHDAMRILGAQGIMGAMPDQRFEMVPLLTLTRFIEQQIALDQPDTIFTHWPHDLNADHRRVAEAVLVACRPCHWQGRLYAFETPSSTEWAPHLPAFQPTTFMAVSEAAMEKKLAAWACYTTEQRDWPHPRSPEALRARGRYWASIAGMPEYCEPLVLLREIS